MSTSPTLSHLKVWKCVTVNYVKNCEKSEILPYFQGNELAWYNFTDAGKGRETPGSETENFITHGTANSMISCLH